MDLIILVKALILGIVEGITEFLPVSSTGHLIIAGDLLNFNDEVGKVFEIVIQLGAILAVCWEFRARLLKVAGGIIASDAPSWRFVINLLIAFLPAAIIGLLTIKAIKAHLFQPFTVAIAFIVGGLVILWVERRQHTPRMERVTDDGGRARSGMAGNERIPRINNIDDMTWKDALMVGIAQTFSLIPGTSRSGATIMGGMIFGLSRQVATEFSFYLAIPTMFAATFYDVFKHWQLLHAHDFVTFAVGFAAAFVSAFFAVRELLRYITQHSFTVFAWYRIVFGILLLVYYRAELFQGIS